MFGMLQLAGEWIDARDAAECTPELIHHQPTSNEELWGYECVRWDRYL
ncbi:MAG: hypothetical protein ACRCWS_04805 [Propionibacteriaceae bacterium]